MRKYTLSMFAFKNLIFFIAYNSIFPFHFICSCVFTYKSQIEGVFQLLSKTVSVFKTNLFVIKCQTGNFLVKAQRIKLDCIEKKIKYDLKLNMLTN